MIITVLIILSTFLILFFFSLFHAAGRADEAASIAAEKFLKEKQSREHAVHTKEGTN